MEKHNTMPRKFLFPRISIVLAAVLCALIFPTALTVHAQEVSGDTSSKPLFTSSPTILLRTPNTANLAKFYEALGMKIARVSERGSVFS
jgi:hypothetical protein